MRSLNLLVCCALLSTTAAYAASPSTESTSPRPAASSSVKPASTSTVPGTEMHHESGRFQLFLAPGHSGSPFLLDTATGCIWHQVQHQETKRTTFVEVDVENLHWSWGSGAQQILASRVDGSNLTDEQKRALKENLQKTGCGLSNVVLTPGPAPSAGQAPGTQQPAK